METARLILINWCLASWLHKGGECGEHFCLEGNREMTRKSRPKSGVKLVIAVVTHGLVFGDELDAGENASRDSDGSYEAVVCPDGGYAHPVWLRSMEQHPPKGHKWK